MAQHNLLSNREQEVVQLLLQGKSNKLIASSLGISESTVEFHLKNIYNNHQVSSRTELILKLGNSTGADMTELGHTTVAEEGKVPENRDKPNFWNWATSLREAVSINGKEQKMEGALGSNVREDGSSLTFFEAIYVCLTKYAEFNGRASRSEFWWFTLFVVLVGSALTYIHQNATTIFLIATVLPFLAAGSRRLHDIEKSGWWQLFILVPVAGIILMGIMWAIPPTSTSSE